MKIMLTMSLALALLAVGCKEKGTSVRERTLATQIKRLEVDLTTARSRAGTLESDVKKAEDDNAKLKRWVAERGSEYAKFETAKILEVEELREAIKELGAQIVKLKTPVPLPDAPTAEDLQRTIATAREKLEQLGGALLDAGSYGPARDALLVARQLGSSKPEVCYKLARASAELKMDEAAEENFRLALVALMERSDNVLPLMVRCHLGRGAALYRLGEPKEAVAEWQKALKLEEKNAAAHYNLGLVYRELKQPDDAVAALRKHITLGGDRAASAREMIKDLLEP